MTSPMLSDLDYLREIEHLANRVKLEASSEGWLSYQEDPEGATALQRSVNALARALRHYHFDGDGCLEEDRPLVRLMGASVLKPGCMPAGVEEGYDEVCARKRGSLGPTSATPLSDADSPERGTPADVQSLFVLRAGPLPEDPVRRAATARSDCLRDR
ncbi:hypothetical protein [Streptomyces sp. NPDC008240]|uniref:hypothetical protein n=1 Tax=Streptomyces sp. NPDC008240 TaxID=3364822 RepID=UPI0036E7FBE3